MKKTDLFDTSVQPFRWYRLTNWFPFSISPIRRGVYQVRVIESGSPHYSYWSGKHWCLTCLTANAAASYKRKSKGIQRGYYDSWRGLAEGHR